MSSPAPDTLFRRVDALLLANDYVIVDPGEELPASGPFVIVETDGGDYEESLRPLAQVTVQLCIHNEYAPDAQRELSDAEHALSRLLATVPRGIPTDWTTSEAVRVNQADTRLWLSSTFTVSE